jgi:hypothetical protein
VLHPTASQLVMDSIQTAIGRDHVITLVDSRTLLLILLALLCQGCACIRAYQERDDPPPMANWNGPYFLSPGNYGTWTVPKWF